VDNIKSLNCARGLSCRKHRADCGRKPNRPISK